MAITYQWIAGGRDTPVTTKATEAAVELSSQYTRYKHIFEKTRKGSLSINSSFAFEEDKIFTDAIIFQYNPETVVVNRNPVYGNNTPPGYSHSLQQFGNSGPREISFSLYLHCLGEDPEGNGDLKRDIERELLILEAACVPESETIGGSEIVTSPPQVVLYFGESSFMGILPGIITGFSARIEKMWPKTLKPMIATAAIKFRHQPVSNLTAGRVMDKIWG